MTSGDATSTTPLQSSLSNAPSQASSRTLNATSWIPQTTQGPPEVLEELNTFVTQNVISVQNSSQSFHSIEQTVAMSRVITHGVVVAQNASVELGNPPTGPGFNQDTATYANPDTAEMPVRSDTNPGTHFRDYDSNECAAVAALQDEMQEIESEVYRQGLPPTRSERPTKGNGIVHPSAILHQWLLEKFPDAQLVISDDWVWMSVLNEGDVSFPDEEEFITRILATYDISYDDGIVTVEPKNSTLDLHGLL